MIGLEREHDKLGLKGFLYAHKLGSNMEDLFYLWAYNESVYLANLTCVAYFNGRIVGELHTARNTPYSLQLVSALSKSDSGIGN